MTVTVADFRAAFPAFANPVVYPPDQIQFWLDLGTKLQDPNRWGELFDGGLQLFVAHNVALEQMGQQGGGNGGVPGQVNGPVTSATVDRVSYSRDPSAAMEEHAGHWNLTIYGMRYIRLARMIGAGPVQVGAPGGPGANEITNGQGLTGWPGVLYPFANQ